jgi:hypothetical protein
MANLGKFGKDQLWLHMKDGVPLSQQPDEPKSKNLVLPKMLPDAFQMSFYNSKKKPK